MKTHLQYLGAEDPQLQAAVPASLPAIRAQPGLRGSQRAQGRTQRCWGLRLIPTRSALPGGMSALPQICGLCRAL